MRALYQLLIAGILACVSMAAAAPIAESGTLSTAVGDITWDISGSSQQGGYDTDISGTHAYITGVNGVGGSDFDASISAETDSGDWAEVWAEVDTPNIIDNFGLYGYLAPNGNLAWTGLYADELSGEYVDVGGYSYTHEDTYTPVGYQDSEFEIDTSGGSNQDDFKAEQVYLTSQAGGSADSSEFPVGGNTVVPGAEGSYAMSNLEYGTFSINEEAPDGAAWELYYGYADAYDPFGNYIYTYTEEPDYAYITEPGSAFKVNSVNMNYADADLAYSNIDWGIVSHTQSDAELTDLNTYAEHSLYITNPTLDDYVEDYTPDRYLSQFDNVFAYGLAMDGDIEADIIFY